ncbi:hypothetical protein F2Q69_00003962 [Brassica cretica]|uniref:Uncharacterized protein n=1 Tax=Brassica cretica TaxID=69181 RepID=A0A8S9NWX7_BRACR|nr:hypothetical protein F2Q69_00003962 [Brassica cretica]
MTHPMKCLMFRYLEKKNTLQVLRRPAAFTSSPTKALALVSKPTWQCGQNSHVDVLKIEEWKGNSKQMSKKQEERRTAYAEEASNNSLPNCSLFGHFSVGTQAMLNDEAVVGHPSTVEMLEDRSCDRVLCSHIKSLVVPMFDCDVKPKPSKSKNKKPHMPLHKSSKSKKVSPLFVKTRCFSALSGQKKVMIENVGL